MQGITEDICTASSQFWEYQIFSKVS